MRKLIILLWVLAASCGPDVDPNICEGEGEPDLRVVARVAREDIGEAVVYTDVIVIDAVLIDENGAIVDDDTAECRSVTMLAGTAANRTRQHSTLGHMSRGV